MSSVERNGRSKDGIEYTASGPVGSKSALIFIHGWACEASDYQCLTRELRERECKHRIIAVDLPGHGNTPKTCCPQPSMSAFAEQISNLINELRLRNTVVVGHSMGCRIAVELWKAINQSDSNASCNGVVFLDGSHYSLRPGRFAFDRGDPRHGDLSQEQIDALKEQVFQRMFSDHTPPDFKASTLAHVKAMDAGYSSLIRETFIEYDYNAWDQALESLGSSGTPLLSFQSNDVDANNQRVQLKTGQKSKWMVHLGRKVPQVKLCVIENSGHFPHVDQSSEVSKMLLDFVENIDRTTITSK